MAYNAIFERLVDQSDDAVKGYVAYGIYKQAKREWIQEFKAAHENATPTTDQLEAYVATWTPQLIKTLATRQSRASQSSPPP